MNQTCNTIIEFYTKHYARGRGGSHLSTNYDSMNKLQVLKDSLNFTKYHVFYKLRVLEHLIKVISTIQYLNG